MERVESGGRLWATGVSRVEMPARWFLAYRLDPLRRVLSFLYL
jgi:hypothetical protein